MGSQERKEREKEIRRNDIIEAAEKVFFAKGYHPATMDDVAKEAQYSKRTVYVYFNSKEQIYFEIMLRGYRLLNRMLDEELAGWRDQSAVNRIKRLGHILYRFSNDYPDYFRSIMEYENSEEDFDPAIPNELRNECYEQGERMYRHLAAALEDGVREGTIRSDIDVVRTALILWSCAVGVFSTTRKKEKYIRHYHGSDPGQLVAEAFDLLIRSIQT